MHQTLWTAFLIVSVLLSPRATSLAERLAGVTVEFPDGRQALVLPPAEGPGDDDLEILLTPERLETCLETVSEAEAWPAAWLVVQRADLDSDLVMRVELDEQDEVSTSGFLFMVPRREWDPADLARVVREATGRKPPRAGKGNLVIQGFSTRVVTTHVYDVPEPDASARGLRALLSSGTLIRESKAFDLGGRRYTLALVLSDATFVPSSCDDCASKVFGHADSGRVELVLTDEEQIIDRIDLTPHLRGVDGTPRVPRYACEEGHATPESLLAREPNVRLLELTDLDGDGRALEVLLPAEHVECDTYLGLPVSIRTDGQGLTVSTPLKLSR